LVFENDFLYEGTGLHEKSSLRKVELATGSVIQMKELPRKFFGEGVTIYENRIIQLTWRSHTGFVYDKESFALLQEFSYPMEGWGITHDGSHLIMSDGTSTLHFLDPHTFKEVDQITVTDANGLVSKLNELEYVKGEIYANVWPTERVAMIKPHTGQVSGWIELSGLLRKEDYDTPMDVLNGIAYDEKDDRLFVTGKWWPTLFEIKLIRVK
jgi:glutamine cyclotransferase